jgi:serine/threonine protein kinase
MDQTPIYKVYFKLDGFTIGNPKIINSFVHVILDSTNSTNSTSSNNSTNSNNIINSTYKIINYLGSGTIGQVYLLESPTDNSKYVIKISHAKCESDLRKEVKFFETNLSYWKTKPRTYPIAWGCFENLNALGVMFNYFGFYNLEKIRSISYKLTWENKISIIKQIINQLIELKPIIHGDLKSSNVVIDTESLIPTVIDYGLSRIPSITRNIISTCHVTSPESLFTLSKYSKCLVQTASPITFIKHDYYGLYTIVLDLFLIKNYWTVFSREYISDWLGINPDKIFNKEPIDIFTLIYYRFFYNWEELPQINPSYHKLIKKIQNDHPTLISIPYVNFDKWFNQFIKPNIDYTQFEHSRLELFKSFLIKIVHFNYKLRVDLDILLTDPFIN